ncbi:30S ribosomal protein S4 [Candidatus Pacearchaeota archaeon]|jgi:small subunit ribosomal protein S4|nr:30S ribosomal protein S4 [Candidatus Pacearchaeota archaeon]|tara:strand:+ start:815 stop:1360 length:546 start_codon:yes stop_codon:yes gene_type:complete
MKRKHKSYSRPKRPFDKERLVQEESIKKEFGLKNKKEIWKSEARIKSIREKAKTLISASPEEQKALFNRLKKIGLNVNSIADILSLEKQDYLKRRLQTILVSKKFSTTSKSARQLITHKKVLVNGNIVDSPSYIVPIELEGKISLKKKAKKEKKQEVKNEENQEEVKEETPVKENKEEIKK